MLTPCLYAPITGLRGACFLIANASLDLRLRTLLFGAIAKQDISFFDATETGDITSRMTSDVTKVSDAVPLNVNVFLRSFVQGKSNSNYLMSVQPRPLLAKWLASKIWI